MHQLFFVHNYLAGLSWAELGPPEARVMLIGRYCMVTGLGLTKERLGGQVAWTWPASERLGFTTTSPFIDVYWKVHHW